MPSFKRAAAAAVILCGALTAQAQAKPLYQAAKTVALGAPDRWDYVVFDAPSQRVYVAHGDRLSVIDGRSGQVLGQVLGIPGGTHGVAISPVTGQGYTDDGKAGVAVSFDPATFRVTATIKADDDADAIAADPVSGHIFVIEGDPAQVTVIDPKTNTVVANIDGGGKLEFGVADGQGHVYVNGEAKHEIVRIDTRTNLADAHWPMPSCESPHGLAIDTKGRRLFSGCSNSTLVVVNADTGAVTASLPIGKGSDAVAFDAKRGRVLSANGKDGTLSVIQQITPDTYKVAATIPTLVSGKTLAVSPQTGRVFIAAADTDPNAKPGGRPVPRPGTLKLLMLDPVD